MGLGGMPRKKKGDDFDFDNPDADIEAAQAKEEVPAGMAKKKDKKKDKKGKGKGKADESDDDAPSPMAQKAAEADEDDAPAGMVKKGGKGKKAAPAAAASFAALENEGGGDDDESDSEEEAPKPKGKGKSAAASFAALNIDDDDEESEDESEDEAPAKAAPKKAAASFAALMGDDDDDEDEDEEDSEEEEAVVQKPVEKKSDKKDKDKKKDKKESKKDKPEDSAPAEVPLPKLSPEEQKVLKTALKDCVFQGVVVGLVKDLAKHPKANDLYILTVTDGGFTTAQVVTNNKKVNVGDKVAFAPVGSEVADEDLGVGTTTIKPVKLKGVNSAGMLCSGKHLGLNDNGDDVLTLPPTCPLGADIGEAYILLVRPEVMDEARKKAEADRVKAEEAAAAKKAAKEAAAAKKAEEEAKRIAEGGAPEGEDKKGKKGKDEKKPAANSKLAALQEMQRRLREQEEAQQRLIDEQKAAEEEAARLQKEEEEAEEERRRIKKEKKKEKEDQLRKEGKLLSKKQKAEKEKNEAYRKHLEAQGAVPALPKKEKGADDSSSDEDGEGEGRGGGEVKKMTKNELKQREKERKDRLKALAEEREKRKKAEEEARKQAELLAKQMEGVADNWEDSDDEEGKDGDAAKEEEEDIYEDLGSGSEYDSDGVKLSKTARAKRLEMRRAEARRYKKMEVNLANKSKDNLRCPIICVLGHVDTGKTKILDKIRRTNVQDGEAGGITQQIGASYFPVDAITEKTLAVKELHGVEYNVPGLLIIDTPGHESFTNLRTRGSSLCDLAVLVVDIMHGLEPQTIESIGLLKKRKAPFIIALNKIDRLYGWKAMPELPVQSALEQQAQNVRDEFKQRYEFTVGQLAEQGLNACVFYENKDVRSFINMVPTSAISGDGMMDLLFLLTTLPSKMLVEKIMFHENLECTVLEVKAIEGLGTTMDVVVVNGRLKEKQNIVVCGLDGPIVTQIRSLLTPQPMKEMRVKTPYLNHKEIKGAIGVKICATGIERALAGSNLFVLGEDDNEEELREEVMKDLGGILKKVRKNEDGVYVQASTLGSLEALLQFLEEPGEDRDGKKNPPIPVSGIGIGPVSKHDVMRCGVMLEREREWVKMCEKEHAATGDWISGNPLNSFKEAYACILAFDVPVLPDAERLAKEIGIKIYTAEIIYHLFDSFMARVAEIKAKKKEEARKKAVVPCVFRIVDDRCIFNKKDPYILGVDVIEGTLKIGTPICIPNVPFTGDAKTQEQATEVLEFGNVMSIEKDKKQIEYATRLNGNIAIRIEQRRNAKEYTLGRHWSHESWFLSKINRESIDLLKEHFRDDLPKEDWKLIVKLKKVLNVV